MRKSLPVVFYLDKLITDTPGRLRMLKQVFVYYIRMLMILTHWNFHLHDIAEIVESGIKHHNPPHPPIPQMKFLILFSINILSNILYSEVLIDEFHYNLI